MQHPHSRDPIHIQPKEPLAERVLLPGDPHRAMAVAQALMEEPKMFNHARGLWGYSGTAADGQPLTVQATGMGGPSAAIVVEELIALGAQRLVRIGTCGALNAEVELGQLLAAVEVLPEDGVSAALGADGALRPDAALTDELVAAGARPVAVVSTDLFYDPRAAEPAWLARGAEAVEMEGAALLRIADLRGVRAACVLAVSDVPGEDGPLRIGAEELEEAGIRLGQAAYSALAATR